MAVKLIKVSGCKWLLHKEVWPTFNFFLGRKKSDGFSHFIWAVSWQNQQNDKCAQQRLRSAWASAQSDQSLHYPPEESLGP